MMGRLLLCKNFIVVLLLLVQATCTARISYNSKSERSKLERNHTTTTRVSNIIRHEDTQTKTSIHDDLVRLVFDPPSPPMPMPMPTAAQLRYAENEIMALIHFNMATYFQDGDPACNEQNWGGLSGSGNPATFNPYLLDTDQWARVFQRLGAKHAVLTAKHGCGFLLWPSPVQIRNADTGTWQEYEYRVGRGANSSRAIPFDVLDKFVTSMRKADIGVGFYYSLKNNFYLNIKNHHFDKNYTIPGQVNVTKEDYEIMALAHLRELWTNYGNLTEHWFDFGYTESIKQRLSHLLQELQPDMIVWKGEGITKSAISWVGTESGFPDGDDIWSTGCEGGNPGHPDSPDWCPKGCDTTLQLNDRWFHVTEADIRSLEVMVQIYHKTVGRNGVLELDIAVDKTGRIRYDHAVRYEQLGDYIRHCYGNPLMTWKNVSGYVIDLEAPSRGDADTPFRMDRVMMREDQWRGGQRVRHFKVYVEIAGSSPGTWTLFSEGHSIGNKRIDILNATDKPLSVNRVRFHAVATSDVPLMREISIFARCQDPATFTAITSSTTT